MRPGTWTYAEEFIPEPELIERARVRGDELGAVPVGTGTGAALRMLAAANKARDAAKGHEAVCVSHQLPVYTLRRFLEGQRLWHDPRRRQCSLASLTSLIYDDDAREGLAILDEALTVADDYVS